MGCWPEPHAPVRVPNIDMAAILSSLDAWQRRHPAVAFPVAVIRKFVDDRASNLAALVTYYAFFSVFPLVLVFVSILGYLLQDDPTLRNDIVDSAVGRIPVVGTQLENAVEPLTGSSIALAVGLATALWAGLGVMLALTRAFERSGTCRASSSTGRSPPGSAASWCCSRSRSASSPRRSRPGPR